MKTPYFGLAHALHDGEYFIEGSVNGKPHTDIAVCFICPNFTVDDLRDMIHAVNQHAALVAALTNLMAVPEVKKAAVNWATDELLAAYTALDAAKQGGAQ